MMKTICYSFDFCFDFSRDDVLQFVEIQIPSKSASNCFMIAQRGSAASRPLPRTPLSLVLLCLCVRATLAAQLTHVSLATRGYCQQWTGPPRRRCILTANSERARRRPARGRAVDVRRHQLDAATPLLYRAVVVLTGMSSGRTGGRTTPPRYGHHASCAPPLPHAAPSGRGAAAAVDLATGRYE